MLNSTSSNLPRSCLRATSSPRLQAKGISPDIEVLQEVSEELKARTDTRGAGVEVSGWSAFLVPAKTPRDIITKIHGDTVAALAQPAVKGKLEQGGVVVIGSTPDQLDSFLGSEIEKWGQVIKEANIRAQ
jgi:Tripartite tricarboxylate transporter family receptor